MVDTVVMVYNEFLQRMHRSSHHTLTCTRAIHDTPQHKAIPLWCRHRAGSGSSTVKPLVAVLQFFLDISVSCCSSRCP